MRFQQVLHDHDIPVAKVYGWIDDPMSFVMDRVPGEQDFAHRTDEERDGVFAGAVGPVLELADGEALAFAGGEKGFQLVDGGVVEDEVEGHADELALLEKRGEEDGGAG